MKDETSRLSERFAVLEEQMNTLQANLTATLEGFRTDQARLCEDMAKSETEAVRRETEAVKRDKDNQRWTVGFGIAQIILTLGALAAGFALLGVLFAD